MSQLTLAAISKDRLLALLLRLRYRQVVTLKRTYVTVISLWISSAVGCIMYGFWSELVSSVYSYIILTLSLVISIFFLHEDFPQAASSSKSTSRQCYRSTEPNNSTKHSAIQEDSVQCAVAAVDVAFLLSTICCSGAIGSSKNTK